MYNKTWNKLTDLFCIVTYSIQIKQLHNTGNSFIAITKKKRLVLVLCYWLSRTQCNIVQLTQITLAKFHRSGWLQSRYRVYICTCKTSSPIRPTSIRRSWGNQIHVTTEKLGTIWLSLAKVHEAHTEIRSGWLLVGFRWRSDYNFI